MRRCATARCTRQARAAVHVAGARRPGACAARRAGCRRGAGTRARAACRAAPWRGTPSASARTVTSSASPFATPVIENSSRPVSPSEPSVVAGQELQRQDAHHQQVRAVDPLVALGDHRLHAEQVRALGRPVARRARAVLLAREHDQRHALGEVALRGLEDRRLLAVRQVHRPRALRARARAGCAGARSRTCRAPSPRGCRVANRTS